MCPSGGTTGAAFILQDEEGEFLTVKEEAKEPPEAIAPESPHEGEEMEALQTKLEAARVENIEPWQQLNQGEKRFWEVWQTKLLVSS